MKTAIVIVALFIASSPWSLFAQNLVSNPSFEKHSKIDCYHCHLDPIEFERFNAQVTALDETPQRQEDGSWVYSVKAQLPDSLRTTYGNILPITARMPGQAVLITEDRRILERVFARLVDLVKN